MGTLPWPFTVPGGSFQREPGCAKDGPGGAWLSSNLVRYSVVKPYDRLHSVHNYIACNRRSRNSILGSFGSIGFAWNAANPDSFGNLRGILETRLLCQAFGPERFRQDYKFRTSVLEQEPPHFHDRLIPCAVAGIGTR